MICMLSGSPALLKPEQTESAGEPVRLKTRVKEGRERLIMLPSSPSFGATVGMVGVMRRSTVSNTLAISAMSAPRWRSAFT